MTTYATYCLLKRVIGGAYFCIGKKTSHVTDGMLLQCPLSSFAHLILLQLLLLFLIPLEQKSVRQVHLTFPHNSVKTAPGLDLQTTIVEKCPNGRENGRRSRERAGTVFNDESRFTPEADGHRLHVWRDRGQWSQSAFVLQRHAAITPGVMVESAISYDSRPSLVILHTSLTAQRYVDTILRLVVLPFMARHPGAGFQQDNSGHI
ncbi:transposable element Tc1 transposase [Trichonephila clavipes]|nr:transposable element Tc1 transposase [Trichonephila clavipes]